MTRIGSLRFLSGLSGKFLCARQTDRQTETGKQRGLEIESHSKILISKTCSLETNRQTDRCYLKFDSIAVVAYTDCKIKHMMQKENMDMLYLVEILSKTLSVQIHLFGK